MRGWVGGQRWGDREPGSGRSEKVEGASKIASTIPFGRCETLAAFVEATQGQFPGMPPRPDLGRGDRVGTCLIWGVGAPSRSMGR